MTKYDLHSHSTASDGTLTPSALVARAKAQGVDVLALTDHDETAGLPEAMATAEEVGLVLIPGIEVSVTWSGRVVHIVGLGIEAHYPPLVRGLERLREQRDRRAAEIGRRLAKHGIPGAFEGAKRLAGGAIVSRTHFARFLVEERYASDMNKVFKRFLVPGKPGHVAGQWAGLEQAVGWINDAGGQAVVAHPARYGLSRGGLLRLLGEFKDCGGVAMEVVSGSHSPGDIDTMAAYARQTGLYGSVGSDYHGPENPWIELGRIRELPVGVPPIWSTWQNKAAIPGG